ncbi:MAG: transposase [Verrucomicrobiales bacterium]
MTSVLLIHQVGGDHWATTWLFAWFVVPIPVLGNSQGKFQTHGCAVHDKFDHEGLIHLECWSHARRPFHQLATVLKVDAPKSPVCRRAIGIVETMGKLYLHERPLREIDAPPEQPPAHRQGHCVPLLPAIKEKVEAAKGDSLPRIKLGKACA